MVKIPGINIDKKVTIMKKELNLIIFFNHFNLDKTLLDYSYNEKIWKRVIKSNQIDLKIFI